MGQGVCVNALAPGYIATQLTEGIRTDGEREAGILARVPAGRWGLPEDLAGAVVYLASRARYVGFLSLLMDDVGDQRCLCAIALEDVVLTFCVVTL